MGSFLTLWEAWGFFILEEQPTIKLKKMTILQFFASK